MSKCLNCPKEIEDGEFCSEKCNDLYWKRVERVGSEKALKEDEDFYNGLLRFHCGKK